MGEYLIVGRVRRAHGVRGELLIEPITDAPDEVFSSGRRLFVGSDSGDASDGLRPVTVESSREFKGERLVRFADLADRNEADTWRHRYLFAEARELAPPAGGQVYVHDLLGMKVSTREGETLGTVRDVFELPHGLLLDVDGVLLPFTDQVILKIDAEARQLVVNPPEGLLE